MKELKPSLSKDKQYKSWAKTSKRDGLTKEIKVEEIENGFLVCLEEWGEKGGKYFNTCRKYYSKDNPLADDDLVMDNGLDKAIDDFINNM